MSSKTCIQCAAVAVALVAVQAAGGEGSLTGPVSGYIFDDRAGSIHAIHGMPGAATLGPAVGLPVAVRKAFIESRKALAIVVTQEDPDAGQEPRVMVFRGLGGESPAGSAVEGALADPDSVAFGSGGNCAILYSKREARLQTVTGLLDEQPRAGTPFDVTALAGETGPVEPNGDCSAALAGTVEDIDGTVSGALYLIAFPGADQAPEVRFLAPAGKPAAIRFINDRDALAADAGRGEVLLIRDAAQAASMTVLAGPAEGFESPVAIGAAGNGSRAVIAGAGKMLIVDTAALEASRIVDLPITPTRCSRLAADGLFLLNGFEQTPVFLFDAWQESAYFLPAK